MSTQPAPAPLVQLPTGVPGLDEVVGGGIPEYSCTLIAGGPGSGKSTLAQQILFANTSIGRPGVYFTGAGQAARKLLAYQQQFAFFDPDRINRAVHFVNLSQYHAEDDAERTLETIRREVEDRRACVVVVDVVRALMYEALWNQLVLCLARCEATTILVGEYDRLETGTDAAASAADVVLWLRRTLQGDATVRTLEPLKVRGQEPLPGVHGMQLTPDGVEVFPRWPTPKVHVPWSYPPARQPVGIQDLDDILEGGVPTGDALLVEGPSGTGKSVLGTHFLAHGGHRGEPGVAFLFEERPDRFIARAEAMNLSLERLSRAGLVDVLSFRGRDMSADELIAEMQRAITRVGARRVVIDSATGLELVLSGARGLRDCLWRLLDQLSNAGLTVWLNASTQPVHAGLGSLVDDVLTLRRVEHETWIENRLGIAKMRWSAHSASLYSYQVHQHGVRVTEAKAARPSNGCLFDVPTMGGSSPGDRSLAIAS